MKLLYGAIALVCTPLVIAGNDAAYPTEKLAAFVAEKVDVTTLPSAGRETWKEFDSCPAIGGGDQDSTSAGY